MTGRERILTVFRGEVPDRVPVAPFVQEEFLSYIYPEKKHVDRVYDAAECALEFGFDLMVRPKKYERPDFLKHSYDSWEVSVSRTVHDNRVFKTTVIKTPERVLRGVETGPDCGAATVGIHFSTTEYLLKDKEDIEAFIKYMPGFNTQLTDEMCVTTAKWKKAIGDMGIVVPWGWGTVYNSVAELRNIELLMTDACLEPWLYTDLMNRIAEAQAIYNSALARVGIECVGLQGNVANGAMVGEDFYRKHIQPYEQKVVDAVKAEGAYVLYHNCGWARTLYRNYIEMGFTAWETVAGAPQGDNNLAEAKETIGRHMCLIGNMDQVNFLKQSSVDEVTAKTKEIMLIGKSDGRYIFAASDFIEQGTPLENFRAMINAAKASGGY